MNCVMQGELGALYCKDTVVQTSGWPWVVCVSLTTDNRVLNVDKQTCWHPVFAFTPSVYTSPERFTPSTK